MNIISAPESLAESNFMLTHGMQTRAQWAAAMRQRDESDRQQQLIAPYNADVPGRTAKARPDALVAWRDKTAGELDALLAKRAKLQVAVNAPAAVQAKRAGLLKTLAAKLMGGADAEALDVSEASAADADLSAATARADAAKIAVAELDRQIESKRLGLARLKDRQDGFVQAAMLEYVEAEYGNRYRTIVMDLRALAQAIWAARTAVGIGPAEDVPSFGLIDNPAVYPDREARRPFNKMINDLTK